VTPTECWEKHDTSGEVRDYLSVSSTTELAAAIYATPVEGEQAGNYALI